MRKIVVFYSRDGNTRKVGKQIAKTLDSEKEEIIDLKKRKGIIGWIIAGKDAFKRKKTKIEYTKNPGEYDLVVIGTPVWAGTLTPAIRTYLCENKFGKVAFFCTYGGQAGKTFSDMEDLAEKKPNASLEFKSKEVKSKEESFDQKIKQFCKKLEE